MAELLASDDSAGNGRLGHDGPPDDSLRDTLAALIDGVRRDDALRRTAARLAAEVVEALSAQPSAGTQATPDAPEPAAEPPADLPVDLIVAHCQLKAEALRWQIQRRQLLDGGAARDHVQARDQDLIGRAREVEDCFLWMCNEDYHRLRDDERYEQAAACYDAVAAAVRTLRLVEGCGAGGRAAFLLVGEAQSALRVAVDRAGWRKGDPVQLLIFGWLRGETKRRQIYVPHMQLKSPADPDDVADIAGRIAALAERVAGDGAAVPQTCGAEKKALYHARRLAEAVDPRAEHLRSDWDGLLGGLAAARGAGLPPDYPPLIEAVRPLAEHVPHDLNWAATPEAGEVFDLAQTG